MSNNYQETKLDLNNFNLSDSDTDSDNDLKNEEHLEIAKLNVELIDKLELQYFPEPYLSLGQFILSSIVGASIAYIMKNRSSNLNNATAYNDYLDIYYKYCDNTTTNDDYLNELLVKFNYISSNDIDKDKKNEKIKLLLSKSNIYAKELASNFFENNVELLNEFFMLSSEDFNLEKLNVELVKIIIPMIKFNKLSQIV